MIYRLTLLSISILFAFSPFSVSAQVIDTITGNSNTSPSVSNEDYNSGNERMTGFVIVPDQTYEIRSLVVEMCRNSTVVTNNIRATLWRWDNGGTPEYSIIGYSDWVDTSTFRDRGGGYCDQLVDQIVFDFGSLSTLTPGNAYILTFNFQSPDTSTSSSVIINRKATSTSATPDTVIDWAYFSADVDYTPWRIDDFTFYLDYIPSLKTSPVLLGGYSTGESYIDIQEILTYNGATTTSYTCSHSSDLSQYYGHCFIIGSSTKDFESIQVVGEYNIPAYDYYYIEGWLKTAPTENATTRPIGDSQQWLPTLENGTYTFSWTIPPETPVVSQFLLSNSAQTYVDGYQGATAQMYVGFCATEEECEDNFWAFTVNGDGTTVSSSQQEAQSFVSEWVEKVKAFAFFAVLFVNEDLYYGRVSTSTASSTFVLSYDMSAFGLPAPTGDGLIDISAVYKNIPELAGCNIPGQACIFTYIDYMLWGLFWLFIFSRILHGAWHTLPEGNSGGDNGRAQARYRYQERGYENRMNQLKAKNPSQFKTHGTTFGGFKRK